MKKKKRKKEWDVIKPATIWLLTVDFSSQHKFQPSQTNGNTVTVSNHAQNLKLNPSALRWLSKLVPAAAYGMILLSKMTKMTNQLTYQNNTRIKFLHFTLSLGIKAKIRVSRQQ